MGPDGSVFGLTTAGDLIRWTGGRWIPVNTGGTWTAVSVASRANDVWLVDARGDAFHWNGRVATEVTSPIRPFRTLVGAHDGGVLGILTDGTLVRRLNGVWKPWSVVRQCGGG